ncbi:hypothetical protein [Segniliparus rugosus]|uniref:Uncharacterized protein n=1 Tax=Segniliparus rugosus (strain ATCC BAA-974 / DSM 45345 / CCUG 50838 / CIP 108380 / JCM 13579 / CDC 945) TaxID=679197 RepID=E5XRL8_SEGRC|nr:hypothetical protein [Segniliparus rugosus]EFV12981.1 hypothetical protein HMPREF9336_02140 [Segniliparus rugosus ATCC BAA-974]
MFSMVAGAAVGFLPTCFAVVRSLLVLIAVPVLARLPPAAMVAARGGISSEDSAPKRWFV